MKKRVLTLVLAVVLVFSLAACGSKNETKDDTKKETTDFDYIKGKGKLVVGITDFAPMDYKDSDGKWIGFDADLATAFAKDLGVDVEFMVIEWGNKIFELDGKTVDCIWNGMTLTDEVTSAMSCSKAYLNNAQVVVMKKSEAGKYPDVQSLKDLTFAVAEGSSGASAAADNGFKTTNVDSQAAALMEVAAGTSDAAIIDSLMAAAMIGEGTSYAELTYTIGLNSEEYGVGFRKGSDMTEKLNAYFDKIKNDGTLAKLAEKYKVQAALIK
jgi:polar amino acid transport system substrate-binding protein